MKSIKLVIIIGLFSVTNIFSAEKTDVMSGSLYRQRSMKQELLFTQREYIVGNENTGEIVHQYFGVDQELAASENVKKLDGKLVSYEIVITELNFKGSLNLSGDKFELIREKNGKIKTKSINMTDNIVVGPMLSYFIKENMSTLLSGEEVNFMLPYFDLMSLIPMRLKAKKDFKGSSDNILLIEMALKSPLLRLLIDPVDFVLDKETGTILEIHGPTILPEPGLGNPRKLVDADIYYTYRGDL